MSKIQKYFNNMQMQAMAISAKNEYIVASRGFGKSEGIDAPRLLRNVFAMPRSAGALLSPTYSKLLQNTLPAVCHALNRLGYKRDIHYYLGKKPPKSANFHKPYVEPFAYDYVMSWFNGSIQHLVSFDRSMSVNSMNLDYILGFEAKFLDYDKVRNEVLPANRGNINYFGNCPWHHGQLFTTDMPTNSKGAWIFEKEKDMDHELISLIKGLYHKLQELKAVENKTEYHYRHIKEITKDLSLFRSKATFYAEYDAIDNLEVLGEEFIRNMKRDLPPILFRTSILNERIRKIANGFYPSLNEKIHYYNSANNSHLDNLDYNFEESQKHSCLNDGDIDKSEPLIIANDYNASINSMVTGQVIDNRLLTLKSLYVKTPRKLTDLCEDWCNYYHYFDKKEVIYFYDSTAIYDTPLDANTFADTVYKHLTNREWKVQMVYIGQPMKHHLKHHYIDLAFKGDSEYLFPLFNEFNNEYLLIAMDQTGVKTGRNGFEKDKSLEKLPDTPQNPDELKTHITDAWDTMFIGCNFFFTDVNSSIPTATSYSD